MAENNSDDPFAPRDGTVLRPRPGAGRRSPVTELPPSGTTTFAQPRVMASNAPRQTTGFSGNISDFLAGTRNPIIQAAAPLLTLGARLSTAVQQANIATLRQQAVQEVRACEERMRAAGVVQEDGVVSRYVLCTFVDSAVLNTPWGYQGDWASQSLLVVFHKEVSGGEKFFDILDRLRGNPARYIDLIELVYVCLALGYEGKYRHDPAGPARLGELQHDLYRIIREQRQMRIEDLSPHWKGVEDRRNPIIRYVPWWVVAAVGLAILTGTFVVLHAKLGEQSEPIEMALAGAPAAVDYPAPTVAARANRLKELLAPQESAGQLTVEDFGAKTVVTLTAPELFKSGSARVNPDLYMTLRAVALALNQVPGRVIIVGHTDDQPVHSIHFADNFALSRERAVAVAELLKPVLTTPGRLEWQGAGSTQPRYKPVDNAENRARNRRVELIQVEHAEPGK